MGVLLLLLCGRIPRRSPSVRASVPSIDVRPVQLLIWWYCFDRSSVVRCRASVCLSGRVRLRAAMKGCRFGLCRSAVNATAFGKARVVRTSSVVKSVCLLAWVLVEAGVAASVVDESSPLETIATEFRLADGPAWDGSSSLYFPDVKGQKLYRYIPKEKKVRVVLEDAGRISASYFSHGALYLSDNAEGRMARLSRGKKEYLTEAEGSGKDVARPNDLVVDSDGGIYFTLTKQGRVMYRRPDGKLIVAVPEVVTPNGITMSPDGSTLYVAEYRPKKIQAYDVQPDGTAVKGREFAVMDDGEALGADGMTIDRAGNVYCAGATDIWIWSPSGKLLTKIACPTRPINCAFGDSDSRSLYITGFGGLYRQRMNAYGVQPELARTQNDQPAKAKRPSTAVPAGVSLKTNVVFGQAGDRKLLMDIAAPRAKSDGPRPCIVVVHGGGWLNGDKTKFRALTLALAKRGYVAAAVGYRLGFEAKFPAGIQDCNAAVRFLRANAADFGIDPDRIGAVGGSAGGHLVGLMATGWKNSKLQGESGNAGQSSKLQAAIVMAGPLQLLTGSVAERSRKPDSGSNSNVWLGATVDEASDLYRLADAFVQIDADSSPALFMCGEHDKPGRNEPSRNKLAAAGVWTGLKTYKDGKHGCWNQLPWFDQMVADMDEFFRIQMGDGR
jgi:gluconolactonase